MNERPYEVWRRRSQGYEWRCVYTGADREACTRHIRRALQGRTAQSPPVEFLTRRVGYWPVPKDEPDVAVN